MIPSAEKSSNSERFLRSLKSGLVCKPTSLAPDHININRQQLSKTTLNHLIAQGAVAAAVAAAAAGGGSAQRGGGGGLLGSHPSSVSAAPLPTGNEAVTKQAIMNLVLTSPTSAMDPSRLQQ